MTPDRVEIWRRYVVTRESVNGEFQVGDHIRLLDNGDLENAEAHGWMPREDVPAATEGMQVREDSEWYDRRREDSGPERDYPGRSSGRSTLPT